jgi:integrase
MPAYQDKRTKKWYSQFRYRDWQGNNKNKFKRGFATKREAVAYEQDFKRQNEGSLEMTFAEFLYIYERDRRPRMKLNTWISKEYIINDKILPYLGDKKMCEIKATDIIAWQNELIQMENDKGEPYSPTYLKTINNQITAIFNHAVRFYELKKNPCHAAGAMGKKHANEMQFWTSDEYMKFRKFIQDEPEIYHAIEMLYWCGMRLGEMLALTYDDVNLEKKTVRINKSYQRIKGKDVVTGPKTEKSNRVIAMPDELCAEIKRFFGMHYYFDKGDRIFRIGKHKLYDVMKGGAEKAGVKKIRIHDLRHSHVSLLIEMGFSAVAIADRLGHESVEITFRYAHLFPSQQVSMADKLSAVMLQSGEHKPVPQQGKVIQLPFSAGNEA